MQYIEYPPFQEPGVAHRVLPLSLPRPYAGGLGATFFPTLILK